MDTDAGTVQDPSPDEQRARLDAFAAAKGTTADKLTEEQLREAAGAGLLGAIGGAITGGLTGAAAGEVIEPAGGGIPGAIIGAVGGGIAGADD
jgi:hypothetical protein